MLGTGRDVTSVAETTLSMYDDDTHISSLHSFSSRVRALQHIL